MKKLSLGVKLGAVVTLLLGASTLIAMVSLSKMDSINGQMSKIAGILMMRLDRSQTLRDLVRRLDLQTQMNVQADREETLRALLRQTKEAIDSRAESSSSKRLSLLRQAESIEGQITGASFRRKEKLRELELVVDQIVADDKSEMDLVSLRAENEGADARFFLAWTLVGTIFLGFAFSFLILRALSRAIGGVTEKLQDNSKQMVLASGELSDSSEELARGAQRQSEAIDEASISVRAIRTISTTCDEAAKKGKKVVEEMIAAIDQIRGAHSKIKQQVNDGNQKLAEITRVIHEIAEKTKILNDIVLQTKLLSFNASVEAARAGTQGKGFAVVAEEVRSLTQLTGNAAREISQMIEESLQKVETIVRETGARVEALTQEGAQKIEFGTIVAAKCSQALDEIASTSDEQKNKVEEILRSVNTTEERARATMEVADEVFRIGQALSTQSLALNEAVASLHVTVKGEASMKAATVSQGEGSVIPFPGASSQQQQKPRRRAKS